jgi:predicted transcriptional regulator
MRRQRIEIMAEILAFCKQRKRRSHIMYGTELSHAQLKTYLKLLMSQDLIAGDSNKYVTTYKGHRFIDAFASLNAFLEDEEHSALPSITRKTSRDLGITQIAVDSQDENGAPSDPPKKAAIVILISLSHEAEKKTSEELKTKIRDALQEGLARIPWIALEDVIVVEEKYTRANQRK